MTESKYLLFSSQEYGELGGWLDFVGAFSELEDAKSAAIGVVERQYKEWSSSYWAHVVDANSLQIVYQHKK